MGAYYDDDELRLMLMESAKGPPFLKVRQVTTGNRDSNFPVDDARPPLLDPFFLTRDFKDLPPGLELTVDASQDEMFYAWRKSYAGREYYEHMNRLAVLDVGLLTRAQMVTAPLQAVAVPVVVAADGSIAATQLVAAVAGHQIMIYEAQLFMENEGAYQGGFAELVSGTTGTVHAYCGAGERTVTCAAVDAEEALNIQAAAGDFAAAASTAGINLVFRQVPL